MHPRFVIFHLLTQHLLFSFSLSNLVIQQGKIKLEPISSRIFHAYENFETNISIANRARINEKKNLTIHKQLKNQEIKRE